MLDLIAQLCRDLEQQRLIDSNVIPWACPVPFFGNPESAEIATLSLNPSNREFVDATGDELTSFSRRFPTLASLQLGSWACAAQEHHELIYEACCNYFSRAPYDTWFKPLDYLISGSSASFYFPSYNACHLDLVAYATYSKWSELSTLQRGTLLEHSIGTLGSILERTRISRIVVNGSAVMKALSAVSDLKIVSEDMVEWSVHQKHGHTVKGIAHSGHFQSIGLVRLQRPIRVLGYNLNLQSSYGVSVEVRSNLRNWITQQLAQ